MLSSSICRKCSTAPRAQSWPYRYYCINQHTMGKWHNLGRTPRSCARPESPYQSVRLSADNRGHETTKSRYHTPICDSKTVGWPYKTQLILKPKNKHIFFLSIPTPTIIAEKNKLYIYLFIFLEQKNMTPPIKKKLTHIVYYKYQ